MMHAWRRERALDAASCEPSTTVYVGRRFSAWQAAASDPLHRRHSPTPTLACMSLPCWGPLAMAPMPATSCNKGPGSVAATSDAERERERHGQEPPGGSSCVGRKEGGVFSIWQSPTRKANVPCCPGVMAGAASGSTVVALGVSRLQLAAFRSEIKGCHIHLLASSPAFSTAAKLRPAFSSSSSSFSFPKQRTVSVQAATSRPWPKAHLHFPDFVFPFDFSWTE